MSLELAEFADLDLMLDDFGVSVTVRDGSTPANEVSADVVGGELRFREPRIRAFIANRGKLVEVREGTAEPVAVEFRVFGRGLKSSGATPTLYEALTRTGAAAGWLSTRAAGEAYCLDVVFTLADPAGGAGDVVTLDDFSAEEIGLSVGNLVDALIVKGHAFAVAVAKEGA